MCGKLNKKSQGSSLIEVLFALLIFSVAILGAGFMALDGLRLSKDALYSTQAWALMHMQYRTLSSVGFNEKNIENFKERVEQCLPQGAAVFSKNNNIMSMKIRWKPLLHDQTKTIQMDFRIYDLSPHAA